MNKPNRVGQTFPQSALVAMVLWCVPAVAHADATWQLSLDTGYVSGLYRVNTVARRLIDAPVDEATLRAPTLGTSAMAGYRASTGFVVGGRFDFDASVGEVRAQRSAGNTAPVTDASHLYLAALGPYFGVVSRNTVFGVLPHVAFGMVRIHSYETSPEMGLGMKLQAGYDRSLRLMRLGVLAEAGFQRTGSSLLFDPGEKLTAWTVQLKVTIGGPGRDPQADGEEPSAPDRAVRMRR